MKNLGERILVASVSAGAGHVRAGEALKSWGTENPSVSHIEHKDVLELTSRAYKEFYAGSYLRMANCAPEIWGYLFWRTDKDKKDFGQKILHFINKLNTKKFVDYVSDNNFTTVIATHFLPAEIIGREKRHKNFSGRIYVVVTDFGAHRFWVIPEVDGYFVATEEVKEELVMRGIPQEKILVTGIPIMPEFSKKVDRETVYRELEFSPDIPVILIMSAGFGVGETTKTIAETITTDYDAQVIFVCGRHEKMKKELEKFDFPKNVQPRVFGFVKDIWRYMEIADMLLTKPGGLTVSEALAKSLPIIIINPVPGQEELNSDFLLENGLALKATSIYTLRSKIRKLLANKAILAKMKRAARKFARPFAGREIIDAVMSSH